MRAAAAWLVVAAACPGCPGCGDNAARPVPAVVPACTTIAAPAGEPFSAPADFGAYVAGTLAGWNADGRWFLTGVALGDVSSVQLAAAGSGQLVVDRDAGSPATIDDDVVFRNVSVVEPGNRHVESIRIANLASDGTARFDRAVCDGGTCNVCTAQLVRATHNAGEGEGDGLALLGGLAGSAWSGAITYNVRVLGTTAYLVRSDGLHLIDVSDPTAPAELGHYRDAESQISNDVKLVAAGARRYAIIADSPTAVVDVTDPAQPFLAARILEPAHTVFVEPRGEATYAYFGNYDATCPVYDVTDPVHPQLLGRFDASGTGAQLVHDLSVDPATHLAYLNAWNAGFLVVDFSAPAAPHLAGAWTPTPTRTSHSNWTTFTPSGRHVALHGEEAYGADLRIVDVDPASPTYMQPISEWQTRPWISIHNLMVVGGKAYFTYYQDGVRVLDIDDPAAPVQLGYFNTWDPQADDTSSAFFEGAVGLDVDPARGLVFVADTPRGLLVLADSTP